MQILIWKRSPTNGELFNWVVTPQENGIDLDNVNFLRTRKEALEWARKFYPGLKKVTERVW